MSVLILPVAGKSSRFPGLRPKWLLTMPNGNLMVEESVSLLNLSKVSRVIVVCLAEHVKMYADYNKLLESFREKIHHNTEILMLDKPTTCQAETVAIAIQKSKITGSIYIKDCDNVFSDDVSSSNSVCTINLHDVGLIDAKNKSYVTLNDFGSIDNIVEKSIISNNFCTGGYSFSDSADFVRAFKNLYSSEAESEIYISHIVYYLIMSGHKFSPKTVDKYQDWGTSVEFNTYRNARATIFCDVDGVLLYNGGKFLPHGWKTEPIVKNIEALADLQKNGSIYLIITTSRPAEEREYVYQKLAMYDLYPDQCIFNLPHSKRILINDFSASNPYPSAISINLERDSEALKSRIDSALT